MATPQGIGAGQGPPTPVIPAPAAAAPPPPVSIPPARLALMKQIAKNYGVLQIVSNEELNQLLQNSYRNNPNLQINDIGDDLMDRAEQILDSRDFMDILDKLQPISGQTFINFIKDEFRSLETKTDPLSQFDFKSLKKLLYKIKTNQTLLPSEFRTVSNESLGIMLLQLYNQLKSRGFVFSGGKKQKSVRKQHTRRRTRRARKSTKRRRT